MWSTKYKIGLRVAIHTNRLCVIQINRCTAITFLDSGSRSPNRICGYAITLLFKHLKEYTATSSLMSDHEHLDAWSSYETMHGAYQKIHHDFLLNGSGRKSHISD